MRGAFGVGLLVATVGLAFGACSPFAGDVGGDAGGVDAANVDADVADALTAPDGGGGPADSSVPDGALTGDGCAGSTTFASGLSAYWQFENNANDSTCNGHTLSPTSDCMGGGGPSYATGKLNQGFVPGLTNCAFMTTSSALSFDSNDFTVSLWVKRIAAVTDYPHYTMLGNGQVLIGAWQTTTGSSLPLYPTLLLSDGTAVAVGLLQDTMFNFRDASHTSVWVHIIAFRRANMIGLRVDNRETTLPIMPRALAPAGTFYVARENDGYTWQGTIDEVGVWNRALTPTEMSQLYNGGSGLALP